MEQAFEKLPTFKSTNIVEFRSVNRPVWIQWGRTMRRVNHLWSFVCLFYTGLRKTWNGECERQTHTHIHTLTLCSNFQLMFLGTTTGSKLLNWISESLIDAHLLQELVSFYSKFTLPLLLPIEVPSFSSFSFSVWPYGLLLYLLFGVQHNQPKLPNQHYLVQSSTLFWP